jgi:D-inositol-3-phosphate glycosyltransferase
MFPRRRGAIQPISNVAALPTAISRQRAETTGPRATVTERDTRLERLGVLWSGDWATDPVGIYQGTGYQVAAATWTQAVLRYGKLANVDLFASFRGKAACRQQIRDAVVASDETPGQAREVYDDLDLRTRLRDMAYDALHNPKTQLLVPSYARSRFARRVFPITCSQHGISYSFQLFTEFIPLLGASLYPCDAIVCLTESSRDAMANRLGDIAERYAYALQCAPLAIPRLEQIPWGVDCELFAPRDRTTARRDLKLPLDRPIVLCVGRVRIEDKMDWTPLLLAFQQVARASARRPLFVLGGSNFTDYGERIVSQAAQLGLADDLRTFFNLPPACLPSLYAACDVFVTPADSPSESFGLTILEAMASGRPVVASEWDGYRETVVHGETGFLVRSDWADCLGEVNEIAPVLAWEQEHLHAGQSVSIDVGEMAGYVTRLLDTPELREEMGRRGRMRVESDYAWPVIIARWEALWGELAAVAGTLEPVDPARLDYLQPNYFRHFGHYASRVIDDDVSVQMTVRGKELLAGKEPLFLHPWAHGFLDPKRLRTCLALMKPSRWLRSQLSVGELLQMLQRMQGFSRDQALMSLMWLAKYDLISFGGARIPSSQPLAHEEVSS